MFVYADYTAHFIYFIQLVRPVVSRNKHDSFGYNIAKLNRSGWCIDPT